MGRGGKPRHLDPELGDQDLGGPVTDPRDRAQQPQLLGEWGQDLLDPLGRTVSISFRKLFLPQRFRARSNASATTR